MSQIELKQIYLELGHEINRLSLTIASQYKDALRQDAHETVIQLKPQIDKWVRMLIEREIACYDLEKILESQRDEMPFTRLNLLGVDCPVVEQMRCEMLRIVAKAIMNSYLNSLFKTRSCTQAILGNPY